MHDLREFTDEWIFEGIDAFEPLKNPGRRTLPWELPDWHSISFDLIMRLNEIVEGSDTRIRLKKLPAELACYIGYVALEFNTRQDPLYDLVGRAVVLPLVVAARKDTELLLFRRYLIGLFDRKGTFDPDALNYDELVSTTALGAALGSSGDSLIGSRVRDLRVWLDRRASTGEARFRDWVNSESRPLWLEAAEAAPSDARAWAASFMR
ncbi:MAG: hypothetical protein ACTS22_06335 [Phycisphaerales bacterium]